MNRLGPAMTAMRSAFMVLALGVLAAGCVPHEDFEYIDASEIPPGEGLFSNETGEFEILGVTTDGDVVYGDEAKGLSNEGFMDAPKTNAEQEQVPEGLVPDKRYRPSAQN